MPETVATGLIGSIMETEELSLSSEPSGTENSAAESGASEDNSKAWLQVWRPDSSKDLSREILQWAASSEVFLQEIGSRTSQRLQVMVEVTKWLEKGFPKELKEVFSIADSLHGEYDVADECSKICSHEARLLNKTYRKLAKLGLLLLQRLRKLLQEIALKTKSVGWKTDQSELIFLKFEVFEVEELKDDLEKWRSSVTALLALFHGAANISHASKQISFERVLRNGELMFTSLSYLFNALVSRVKDTKLETRLRRKYVQYSLKNDKTQKEIDKTMEKIRELRENLIPAMSASLTAAETNQDALNQRIKKLETRTGERKGEEKEKEGEMEEDTGYLMEFEEEDEETVQQYISEYKKTRKEFADTEISEDTAASVEEREGEMKRKELAATEISEDTTIGVEEKKEKMLSIFGEGPLPSVFGKDQLHAVFGKAKKMREELADFVISEDELTTVEEGEDQMPSITGRGQVLSRSGRGQVPSRSGRGQVPSVSRRGQMPSISGKKMHAEPAATEISEEEAAAVEGREGKETAEELPSAEISGDAVTAVEEKEGERMSRERSASRVPDDARAVREGRVPSVSVFEDEEYDSETPPEVSISESVLLSHLLTDLRSTGAVYTPPSDETHPTYTLDEWGKRISPLSSLSPEDSTLKKTPSPIDVLLMKAAGGLAEFFLKKQQQKSKQVEIKRTGKAPKPFTSQKMKLADRQAEMLTTKTAGQSATRLTERASKEKLARQTQGKEKPEDERTKRSVKGKDLQQEKETRPATEWSVSIPTADTEEYQSLSSAKKPVTASHTQTRKSLFDLAPVRRPSTKAAGQAYLKNSDVVQKSQPKAATEEIKPVDFHFKVNVHHKGERTQFKLDDEEGTSREKSEAEKEQRKKSSTTMKKRSDAEATQDKNTSATTKKRRKSKDRRKQSSSADKEERRHIQNKGKRKQSGRGEGKRRSQFKREDSKPSTSHDEGEKPESEVDEDEGEGREESSDSEDDKGSQFGAERKHPTSPASSEDFALLVKITTDSRTVVVEDFETHLPKVPITAADKKRADRRFQTEVLKRERGKAKLSDSHAVQTSDHRIHQQVDTAEKSTETYEEYARRLQNLKELEDGVRTETREFREASEMTSKQLRKCNLPDHADVLTLIDAELEETCYITDRVKGLNKRLEPALHVFEETLSNALSQLKEQEAEQDAIFQNKMMFPGLTIPSGLDAWHQAKERLDKKEEEYARLIGTYQTLWFMYVKLRLEMQERRRRSIGTIAEEREEDIAEEKEAEAQEEVPTISHAMPKIQTLSQRKKDKKSELPTEWKKELSTARDAFDEGAISHQDYLEQVTLLLKVAALIQQRMSFLSNSYTDLYLKKAMNRKIESILEEVNVGRRLLSQLGQTKEVEDYMKMLHSLDAMEHDIRFMHEKTNLRIAIENAHQNVRRKLQAKIKLMETIEEFPEPSETSRSSESDEEKKDIMPASEEVRGPPSRASSHSSEYMEVFVRKLDSVSSDGLKRSIDEEASMHMETPFLDQTDVPTHQVVGMTGRVSDSAGVLPSVTEVPGRDEEEEDVVLFQQAVSPAPDLPQLIPAHELSILRDRMLRVAVPYPPSLTPHPPLIQRPRPDSHDQIHVVGRSAMTKPSCVRRQVRKPSLSPFVSMSGFTSLVPGYSFYPGHPTGREVFHTGVDSVRTTLPRVVSCLKTESLMPDDQESERSVISSRPARSSKSGSPQSTPKDEDSEESEFSTTADGMQPLLRPKEQPDSLTAERARDEIQQPSHRLASSPLRPVPTGTDELPAAGLGPSSRPSSASSYVDSLARLEVVTPGPSSHVLSPLSPSMSCDIYSAYLSALGHGEVRLRSSDQDLTMRAVSSGTHVWTPQMPQERSILHYFNLAFDKEKPGTLSELRHQQFHKEMLSKESKELRRHFREQMKDAKMYGITWRGLQSLDAKDLKEYLRTLPKPTAIETEECQRQPHTTDKLAALHSLFPTRRTTSWKDEMRYSQSMVKNVKDWVHSHLVHPPIMTYPPPMKGSLKYQHRMQSRLVRRVLEKRRRQLASIQEKTKESPGLLDTVQDSAVAEQAKPSKRKGWPTEEPSSDVTVQDCKLLCLEMDQSLRKAGRTLGLVNKFQLNKVLTEPGCQHIWNKFQYTRLK